MRVLYFLICLVFVLFAFWQLNDPDPYLWIPIYGMVALEFGLAAIKRQLPYQILIATLGILTIFMFTYIPDLYNWVQIGEPSIVDTMKAERPWVELTREGLGLLLCVLFLGWRAWKRRMP